MHAVFEHCFDPYETLHQIHSVLKPGGKLIIAVPNLSSIERYTFGRLWIQWHTPFHLHLYSQKSMRLLFEKTGFSFDSSKSHNLSAYLLGNWAWLFTHGRKGKRAPFADVFLTRQTDNLNQTLPVRLYRLLEKIRIHAWMTRFADACGMGAIRLYFATKL
jgi:SAM-dependent methyltransferase